MSEIPSVSTNVPVINVADKNGCTTSLPLNRTTEQDVPGAVQAKIGESSTEKVEATKVDMEKELYELAKKPKYSTDELKRFTYLVNRLNECGSPFDNNSVLMSAVASGNTEAVVSLLEKFRALFYTRNQRQESLLHLACRDKSILRYYYVVRCPALLTGPDTSGTLPLHLAAEKNDMDFVLWIFKCILQPESLEDTLSMPYMEHEYSDETYSFHEISIEHIKRFSSPSLEVAMNTKLMAVNVDKQTALHLAIQNGHDEMLGVLLKVVASMPGEANLSVLLCRETFSKGTPLDVAIFKRQPKCLALLLEFLSSNNLLKRLMMDEREHTLRDAVVSEDLGVLKVLLQFGFHRGIEKAISVASARQIRVTLRLLMYYYTLLTQARNTGTLAATHRNSMVVSRLVWKGLSLEEVYPELLGDGCYAILSSMQPQHSKEAAPDTSDLICSLAKECLQYFDRVDLAASSTPSKWYSITEVDLSDNNLNSVPPELFQMPNVHSLSLAQNALKELPTSGSPEITIYTSHKLKNLILDCNQLKSLPEDLIYGLVNCLEELSAQMNQIDELPPGLWIMPHLRRVCLSENKLTQLHYFDRLQYFKDAKFSTKVVAGLSPGDDVKSKSISKYLHRLRMFCRTLHKAEGEEFDEATFVQGILLLHQQRLTQDKMGSLYSSKLYKLLYAGSENELLKTNAEKLSALKNLDLSHNKFFEFPKCIACLAPHLQRLDMRFNVIEGLHLVHNLPPSIITVLLGNNLIRTVWESENRPEDEPCMSLHMLLLPQTGIQHQCIRHTRLEHLTALHLNNNYLETLFGDFEDMDALDQSQKPLASLFPRLSILALDHNNLKSLAYIHQLSSLNSLDLSFNTHIDTLPLEFGVLSLAVLKLEGLKLRGIPSESSTPKLLKYLKNLLNNAKPYRHMKLVAVGNAGSGKTTLLQQLTKHGKTMRRRCHTFNDELSMSALAADFMEWVYAPRSQKKMNFMTWDLGGQSEYFTVYQCFLTKRSLYLVVWNVNDGAQGLRDIQPWLENIEARAPGSPVIVIGTHGDPVAQSNGAYESLEKLFKELYINYNASRFAYPEYIYHQCIIISSFESTQISHLRKCIYEVATSGQPHTGPRSHRASLAVWEDLVPDFYIQLHEIVRELAHQCYEESTIPIYTEQQYRQAVLTQCEKLHQQQCKHGGTGPEKMAFSVSQLQEASYFLHHDGMLFQYMDTAKNEYIYCVNPQWLCMILSNVVSERQKDPSYKNGFVYKEDMQEIYRVLSSDKNGHFVSELGKFMEKLEVILSLDSERVLIPSFLPQMEENATIVLPERNQGSGPVGKKEDISLSLMSFSLVTLEQRTLMRYYILPFIPHDFFPRLIARAAGSSVLKEFSNRLAKFVSHDQKLDGSFNWLCWRKGIKCIWNQLEILTIAPVTVSLEGARVIYIISSSGLQKVERQHSIEINVTVLPQELFDSKLDTLSSVASSLATWLLQQAVQFVESVFNDWYEAFGRSRGFELSLITSASPCPLCQSNAMSSKVPQGSEETERYMFSSTYCARVLAENKELKCHVHGKVQMIDVAPDLMFYDCYPSLVVSSENVVVKQRIGDGGFGTVYFGAIVSDENRTDIAIKEFTPQNVVDEDPGRLAELVAWEKYQNASQEARTMIQLNHKNVLRLMGITLTPMRLLLELAPLGDLKTSVERFKSASTRFNRRTLKAVMTQIAGALEHLHSHSIIYQDLKPGNVLLWQFPKPESQWDPDSVVHVKLADYGICQMDTPQGVKGMQGTPSYLPPEALLQGGRQSHNTKLDVYSFGMFLYFLFTFMNPFEKELRSVAFLLEEGRRPEFSSQYHPSSLWMLELMCWCWSEFPHHRPNFKEILDLLHDDTLTQLISAIPITEGAAEVTAACTRLVDRKPSPVTDLNAVPPTMMFGSLDTSPLSPLSSPALLPQLSQTFQSQSRSTLEVWHGTDEGQVNILQYSPVGCIIEVNVTTLKGYVSSMCEVDENVWVATLGNGIHVFDAATKQSVAHWSTTDYVHVLRHCHSHGCVVALEDSHLRVFSSVVSTVNQSKAPPLTQLYAVSLSCQSTLAYISDWESRDEIWTASQRGTQIIVFDLNSRKLESVPDLSARGGFKLRVIEPLSEVGERDSVAISDGDYLEKWSIANRKKMTEIDCHKVCAQFTAQKRHSTVVSLLALGGMLYAGTEGGTILVLSPSSFAVLSTHHACLKLNRYLLGVKSAQNITLLSKQFSMANRGNVKKLKSTPSTESMQGTGQRASYSFTLPANITNRNIIISFGQYFEIFSKSSNRPPKLQLPAQPSSGASTSEIFASRRNRQSSHMLLWSAWSLEGQQYAEKGL